MATLIRFRPRSTVLGLLGLVAAAISQANAADGRQYTRPTGSAPAYAQTARRPAPVPQRNSTHRQVSHVVLPVMDSHDVSMDGGYSISEGSGVVADGSQVLEPVEVVECGAPVPPNCTSCQTGFDDGSICDGVYRSKGCDRVPCPCPTDEVLSYYRCNFYGHYPTFWRPWPGGFLKYRPEVNETMYDRYRKPEPGQAMAPPGEGGQGPLGQPPASDLDRELQELMRESQTPRNSTEPRVPPTLEPQDRQPPPLPPSELEAAPKGKRELSPPPPLPDQSNRSGNGMIRAFGRFFNNNRDGQVAQRPQMSRRL